MIVSTEKLEQQFNYFLNLVLANGNEKFISFKTCNFFDAEEGYKEEIYRQAKETIKSASWESKDIRSGRIHRTLNDAIKTKIKYNLKESDNNLINHWTIKDNFSKFKSSKSFEQLIFDFYKGKGVTNEFVFNELLRYGHPYNLIAYLFFIKDCDAFVPISQERFDNIFELIGITDFKTNRISTWENYATFIEIIKEVRTFLRTKDKNTTLLDAHSFLWIIGKQIGQPSNIATNISFPSESETGTIENSPEESEELPNIAEESDEETFTEGKELYRLHKSKERNKKLIRTAKQKYFQYDVKLRCQICKFSFIEAYGLLGKGFIEAHHLFPISELKEETETKIEDIALVCSNCHRMLHRRRPWLTSEGLKQLCVNKES